MDENTWGRVKFLVNLMFCRLDKFDGPVFEGGEEGIYMGGLYSGFYLGYIFSERIFGGLLYGGTY